MESDINLHTSKESLALEEGNNKKLEKHDSLNKTGNPDVKNEVCIDVVHKENEIPSTSLKAKNALIINENKLASTGNGNESGSENCAQSEGTNAECIGKIEVAIDNGNDSIEKKSYDNPGYEETEISKSSAILNNVQTNE